MPLQLKRYPARGSNWYIRGTVQGVRVFESTGESQRSKAAQVLEARQKEIFECCLYGPGRSLTFAEAALAYMERTDNTRFLHPIIKRIGMKPISEISQAVVDATARVLYPDRAPATLIRQCYTPIIAVLNEAAAAGLCGKPSIRKPKAARPTVEAAGDTHVSAILPHCSERLQALVLLMTYTGIRVSEACRLEPCDFNLQDGWAICGKTKNGDPRMIPLPPAVVAAIANIMPEEGPVFGFKSRYSVNTALKRAANRAGVPHMSSHKIGRHTFAKRILEAGHSIKTLKEAGGWKSIKIVDETYGHLEQSHVHQVMLDVADRAGAAGGNGKIRKTR